MHTAEIFRGYHPDRKELPGNIAFVFPGQGSQFVGMGLDLYQKSTAARRAFKTIDDVLGYPLSLIMFDGHQQKLNETANAQPAIFAVSIAAVEAARERTGEKLIEMPVVMAGHSLGEYTALVVAGVLKVEDAARLVRERGLLMQKASEYYPGGMAAVLGLDEVTLNEVCQEAGATIANINSEDQIVISGDKLSLARAMDLATIRGARKTIPLEVSGAFHSNFMWPAQEGLERALKNVRLCKPSVEVVGNVTAKPLTSPKAIREELATQLCNTIQWKRTVDYIVQHAGVQTFIEFGPKKTLSSMAKRSYPQIKTASITDFNSIAALVS